MIPPWASCQRMPPPKNSSGSVVLGVPGVATEEEAAGVPADMGVAPPIIDMAGVAAALAFSEDKSGMKFAFDYFLQSRLVEWG